METRDKEQHHQEQTSKVIDIMMSVVILRIMVMGMRVMGNTYIGVKVIGVIDRGGMTRQ